MIIINELAQIYYNGESGEKDIDRALYYYEISSNAGDPFATNFLGEFYFNNKEKYLDKSIFYNSLLKTDESYYRLGIIYLYCYHMNKPTNNNNNINNI